MNSLALFFCLIGIQLVDKPLQINKINENLYLYTTYGGYEGQKVAAHGLYLITKTGVVLFDTPWDVNQIKPLIDSIQVKHQSKIISVFATHSHEDRAGGFGIFEKLGIPTYASEKTNVILKENQKTISSYTFTEHEKFLIGGEKFELRYFGAGHTRDNFVVWFPNYKVLAGGCLIKSVDSKDLGFIGDADIKAWPETLKKIKSKLTSINQTIPGHGNWKLPGSLNHTLKLLAIKR